MMRRHRVLLIDDEPLARQRLRQLFATAPDFDIVGECDDPLAVPAVIRELRPDIVMLDVQMPLRDGFAVRESIAAAVRHVVFVTAHPEFAVRAFDVDAVDYLVKPLTRDRFDAALQRMRRACAGDPASERVMLGGRQGGVLVDPAAVPWIEADGAYVAVHAGGRRHVLRESLGQVVERLGAHRFLRVHRSAAVNVGHVAAVVRGADRAMYVELRDGRRLAVSRRCAPAVIERLHGTGIRLSS